MRTKNKKAFLFGLGLFLFLSNASAKDQAKSNFIIDNRYYDWSLPRSTINEYDKRNLNQIEQIIVHHSGVTGQTVEDYARYHVSSNGWPGIGYHYVIEKDGTITQGNPLDNISYHVAGQNTKSIGIGLSGNFEIEQPTQIQMEALTWLIAHVREGLPQELEVYGHKDFAATSCPGVNLYGELQNFKLAG